MTSRRMSGANFKKFSHAQIADKIAKRAAISDYGPLLMASSVRQDEEGVVFDTASQAWANLVARCDAFDKAQSNSRSSSDSPPPPLPPSIPPPSTLSAAPSSLPPRLLSISAITNAQTNSQSSPSPPNVDGDGDWVAVPAITHVRKQSYPRSTSAPSLPPLPPPPQPQPAAHPQRREVIDDLAYERSLEVERAESDADLITRIVAERDADRHDGKDHTADRARDTDTLQSLLALIHSYEYNPSAYTDMSQLRQYLNAIGGIIPTKYRAVVWKMLLTESRDSVSANVTPIATPNIVSPLPTPPITQPVSPLHSRTPSLMSHAPITDQDENSTNGKDENEVTDDDAATADDDGDDTVHTTLHNQRVIRADIERTIAHCLTFQSQQTRRSMERTLTDYCSNENVSYKQGMNYILSPFYLLGLNNNSNNKKNNNNNNSRSEIYLLYTLFIKKFIPNTFTDNEFGSLQCIFSLFRLILQYHDPELSLFLLQHDMGPELYASSWFITLFANRCKLKILIYLWDFLLIELYDDPLLFYFICLTLIISQRSIILKESIVQLPETLSRLSIHSTREVNNLINKAKRLYRNATSESLYQKLYNVTRDKIIVDSTEYKYLINLPCIIISAEEVVTHLYNSDYIITTNTKPSLLKYFVIDCRSTEQYDNGHLPCAYHISPELIHHQVELYNNIDGLASMKGCHFSFINSGLNEHLLSENNNTENNLNINNNNIYDSALLFFVQTFIKKGFKYVSICAGGYKAAHAIVRNSSQSFELVDHNPDRCLECNGRSLITITHDGIINKIRAIDDESKTHEIQPLPSPIAAIDESKHIPDSAIILPQSMHIRLLHTVLRDKHSDVAIWVECLHSLANALFAMAIERVHARDKSVAIGNDSVYIGSECGPLITLSLSVTGEHVLNHVMRPLKTVVRRFNAHVHWDESTPAKPRSVSAIDMPIAHANDMYAHILVFQPVLASDKRDTLFAIIDALLQRPTVVPRSITISAIVIARPIVWELYHRYPGIAVMSTAVDSVEGDIMIPGVERIDDRYFAHQFVVKTHDKANAETQPNNNANSTRASRTST